MLLKTGQTTSYGGYEDDGHFEAGIAKDYTVLTTGQYAGTTAITLNAKTDIKSNNCVQDDKTGLMWSRYVSATLGPGDDGKIPWTTNVNGEGIYAYCDAANAAELAGYDDWRIANRGELGSLMNLEQPSAIPNAVAFPGWPTDYVWSSTTAVDATSGYRVHFDNGNIRTEPKTTVYPCALVRGGI